VGKKVAGSMTDSQACSFESSVEGEIVVLARDHIGALSTVSSCQVKQSSMKSILTKLKQIRGERFAFSFFQNDCSVELTI
jgi:hypothetical protein